MSKRRANGEGSLRKRKDGRREGRYAAGTDPAASKAIVKSVLGKTLQRSKKLKRTIFGDTKLNQLLTMDIQRLYTSFGRTAGHGKNRKTNILV